MKTNLKKIKKKLLDGDKYTVGDVLMEIEAFETELRKKLVYPTNTKSIAVYDFIKEVLGGDK